MKISKKVLAVSAWVAMAGTSWGANFTNYFRAAAVTNIMGDGKPVVMWGFAKDSSAIANDGIVTVPGPKIALPPGAHNLWISLKNQLPEPVSIVVPGLPGTLGNPQRNPDGRARSLTYEAASGSTAVYSWNNVPAGTYLYHSGSHPAVQVQMGLYGALTKLEAANQAYAGVDTHNSEVTLLFSEVDPALHDAVATGNYGPGKAMSSTLGYNARYFLINGLSYTNGLQTNVLAHIQAANIPNNNAEQNVLVRLLNAGLDSHIPMLNGEYLKVIAEDGKNYTYSRQTCALLLPALKTMDAFWRPTRAGTFPIFDRQLDLVNDTGGPGGMLGYLAVSKSVTGSGVTIGYSASVPISASPYPRSLRISGLQGVVSKVSVVLNGFYHPRPSDVDVLLVGPAGQKTLLMSDVGDAFAISSSQPVSLTFDKTAPASLTSAQLVTGTYKPTNLAGASDTFPDNPVAAPPRRGYDTDLDVFNGTNPNGTWYLFVRDNAAGGGTTAGAIASWNLIITPRPQ